jgi:hypothetical protein
VKIKIVSSCAVALALGVGSLSLPVIATAAGFNPMNAMNPSKWFGGKDRDRYYDDYDYGPPPPGYGAPYGGPGWGAYPGGWGGYPGYGAPGYGAPGYGAPGYGAPGYGAPGYAVPGYGAPATGYATESAPSTRELQERIEKLEVEQQRKAYQQPPAPAAGSGEAAAPGGFRPFTPEDQDYSSGFQPAYGDTQYQSPQLWR